MKTSHMGSWAVVLLALSACATSPGDPFGAPPKGVSPNCGPEHRYKYDTSIRSPGEFIEFLQRHAGELKDRYGNNWVRLDNFKQATPGMNGLEIVQAPVDWASARKAVVTENVGGRTIYRLDYEPLLCPAQQFTLKATQDGHVSLYGCCGK